ncbi:MAG: hypothetical protein K0R18_16 [Bacillales bacterium]|jgi:predicted RNase H-related nuclease YkuK (DUF458 family)|nr:hypothetical protein [Bacillales bacterium]
MEVKNVVWKTPSRGNFAFDEMIKSIREYVNEDQSIKCQIIIGADSQSFRAADMTKYVTVVVVRRPRKGAQYYVATTKEPLAKSLRQKIWHEVMSIYETLKTLELELEDLDIKLIPHVDVGEDGDTSVLIKEVTGIFLAEGYDVQIKPFSYAASGVADKHSK